MNALKNEKGFATVFLAITMVVLIGMLGLVMDYGMVVYEKSNISNALDAAVYAGALELVDTIRARTIAEEYILLNAPELVDYTITFSDDNTKITAEGGIVVEHFFMQFLGIDSTPVGARASAMIQATSGVQNGVRPFAVVDQNFAYGQEITLKVNSKDSVIGNFGAVTLGDYTGANLFREYTLYGYDQEVKIGDYIYTEPGNMAVIINPLRRLINDSGESFESFNRDSDRVWVVPLIDRFDVNGRSQVQVVGFAAFYVNDVGTQSGLTVITGKFIEYVISGSSSSTITEHGLYSARLVE